MIDKDQKQTADDNLDLALDAALAKYSSVEPRTGLEDRVLANLRVKQTLVPARAWWRWGLAALAAIVVVVLALTLRSGKSSHPVIVQHAPGAAQSPAEPQRVLNGAGNTARREHEPVRRVLARPQRLKDVVAAVPKLDQFPSPQPLTEEEKVLVGYIERYPKHAALLAEATMDSLRQNAEERRQIEMKDQRTTQ